MIPCQFELLRKLLTINSPLPHFITWLPPRRNLYSSNLLKFIKHFRPIYYIQGDERDSLEHSWNIQKCLHFHRVFIKIFKPYKLVRYPDNKVLKWLSMNKHSIVQACLPRVNIDRLRYFLNSFKSSCMYPWV